MGNSITIPELAMSGPFGGIQSELAPNQIEALGFADCLNILLRKGQASARPGYALLPPLPVAGVPLAIADFYDSVGNRHQVVITDKGICEFLGEAWVALTGTAFTGPSTQPWSWDIVNNKLCFCQGYDKIRYWDGLAAGYIDIASSVPAFFLLELETHLVSAYTVESGTPHTQRVRWTSAGDPTDNLQIDGAGITDILGNLGPITGLAKIYQQGFVFHKAGITQMIPTGVYGNPFQFRNFGSMGKGNFFPYSLASYGEEGCVYVGRENVFFFDGTTAVPIGSRPLEGHRSAGARAQIVKELHNASVNQVTGFISTDINGNDYKAYWLNIPNGSLWKYNFDEENWTRDVYNRPVSVLGRFFGGGVATSISDLAGVISDLDGAISSLSGNAFDALGVGFKDNSVGIIDFTQKTESSWFIKSGQLPLGNQRTNKSIKRFRLVYSDLAPSMAFTIAWASERGEGSTQQVVVGTGSGLVKTYIVSIPPLTGMFLQWTVSGAAGSQAAFMEFSPYFVEAEEFKNT